MINEQKAQKKWRSTREIQRFITLLININKVTKSRITQTCYHMKGLSLLKSYTKREWLYRNCKKIICRLTTGAGVFSPQVIGYGNQVYLTTNHGVLGCASLSPACLQLVVRESSFSSR